MARRLQQIAQTFVHKIISGHFAFQEIPNCEGRGSFRTAVQSAAANSPAVAKNSFAVYQFLCDDFRRFLENPLTFGKIFARHLRISLVSARSIMTRSS